MKNLHIENGKPLTLSFLFEDNDDQDNNKDSSHHKDSST